MLIDEFINLLPSSLRENLLFRPRTVEQVWDTERMLELDRRKIKIDRGDFTKSILKARIVVLDHMSTGFAELLLMKAPFILLFDVAFLPLPKDLRKIFDDLIDCGVVHTSARTAEIHLSTIYYDVTGWWESESVRYSIKNLTESFLAPSTKTTDYLLSLVETKISLRDSLQFHVGTLVESFARSMLGLLNKYIRH